MQATELGGCDSFVWDLRRSELIEREQIEPLVGGFLEKHPQADPARLAEYLIERKIITRYQAERLLGGKADGLVLGPFTVVEALGVGSMGTVYRARSKDDDQPYAIKVLPRRSIWNMRIAQRKVRDFEQIDNAAVVPFVDAGTAGAMHYLVWPLVGGTPLDKYVEKHGPFHPAVAAAIGFQVAAGLEACHQRGIVHGLLKPSNLLITSNHEVKILDLGIGCLLAEADNESIVDTMSTANTMANNLDCASPESIMDPKMGFASASDQYSLGCILYFCLTGQYPFGSETTAVEKMFAHQTKKPTAIKELTPNAPDELVQIVERLMQKAPASRYSRISFAVAALKPLAEGQVPDTVPITKFRPKAPAKKVEPKSAVAPPAVEKKPITSLLTASLSPPTEPQSRSFGGSAPPRSGSSPNSMVDRQIQVAPRDPPAPPKNAGRSPIPVVPGRTVVSPRYRAANTPATKSWDEKLGPIGLAAGAAVLCLITWLVAMRLF